jgi:ribosomal protein S18 acetylase RimI-like enzyme
LYVLPLRHEEIPAASEIWSRSARSIPGGLHDETPAEMAAAMAAGLSGGWEAYLAWEGEMIVAFMAMKPDERHLDQLFVDPSRQGQGFGAELLDFAKSRMPQGFWLRTATANTGACRFYDRCGLRVGEIGVHPRLGHPVVIYRWP